MTTNIHAGYRWLLIGLIALHLIPVWSFRYFPSQDGPAHVENSRILQQLLLGRSPELAKWYQFNPRPVPNLLGHVIMGGLMAVQMPPAVAEKMVISLFVVGFPLSVTYAARSIRKSATWVGLFSLPFLYSLALHKGLYNFCLSWVLMFWTIGFWLRCRKQMKWTHVIGLALLTLLTYFAHVVSLLMSVMVISGLAVSFALIDLRFSTDSFSRGKVIRRTVLTGVALLPSLLLVALYFSTQPRQGTFLPTSWRLLLPKLLSLDALVAFRPLESWLATGVACLFAVSLLSAVAVKAFTRRVDRWDGLILLTVIALAIYFRMPNQSSRGGGQISFRLSMYPYLLLMLWLAAQRGPVLHYLRWFAAPLVAGLSMGLLALHWIDYHNVNRAMMDFISVEDHLLPHETVVEFSLNWLDYDPHGRALSINARPFVHAIGYLAAERGILDLDNYEAELDYFPVQYRNGYSPTQCLQGSQNDLEQLQQLANKRVDNVLIWQTRKLTPSPGLANLQRQLQQHYQLVFTSPHGMAKLYRPND